MKERIAEQIVFWLIDNDLLVGYMLLGFVLDEFIMIGKTPNPRAFIILAITSLC